MSKLRLCIVSPLFHPNIGGPGRQAVTMAIMFKKKNIDLTVITRKLDIERAVLEGVDIHSVRTLMPQRHNLSEFTFMNFLVSAFFSWGAMVKLFLWRKRYDMVQFYGGSLPLLMCLPVLLLLRKKIIVTVVGARRGMEAGSLEGSVLRPFLSPVFSHVHIFIAMSEELKERLQSEGIPKTKINKISNGVDIKTFYPFNLGEKERLKKNFGFYDKEVIIYSGRLVAGKGLEIFLDAMRVVTNQEKGAYALILGDGPIKNKLKDKAVSLNISESICFEGNVNNVADYLNTADIFVFPSLSEGMPNALLEAMACGLPVIASRIGGVVDVVEDGKSGILFEPGDVSELSSAMIRLLKDRELRQRLGEEARKRIVENFSIDRVADEYIKLYKTLLVDR